MADDRKPKSVGKKNILIMVRTEQTIELSTDLGINYIPCCSIVLMCYNAKSVSAVGCVSHTTIGTIEMHRMAFTYCCADVC